MSIITKLLCIGRFDLPDEIKEEVRTYAFKRIEEKAKEAKQLTNNLIKSSVKKYIGNDWYFSVKDNGSWRSFEANTCHICGGYTAVTEFSLLMNMKPHVLCSCKEFQLSHENNAAIFGYVYNQDTQNYVYDAVFDSMFNGDLDFDVYQEIDLDHELALLLNEDPEPYYNDL